MEASCAVSQNPPQVVVLREEEEGLCSLIKRVEFRGLWLHNIESCSNYGERLGDLTIGDKVGLILTESRCLQISINGIEEEPLALNFPMGQSIYAIFDLYGQCQQIKILNKVAQEEQVIIKKSIDCEKADLESCEKEGSETKLTLPIPSASTSVTSSVIMKTSHSNTPLKSCPYKEEVEKFKKKLLLPDHYFNVEEPICYCQYCSKARSSDEKENLLGWVKFPLSISENMSTDKWHYAFYFTKLGGVRCILDRGQPLTKGQAKWCNFTGQKADDVQIVFYPSLQTILTKGYKTENNREVYAAFQLLVKPGAYSISRDTDVTEWSTKESGALASSKYGNTDNFESPLLALQPTVAQDLTTETPCLTRSYRYVLKGN